MRIHRARLRVEGSRQGGDLTFQRTSVLFAYLHIAELVVQDMRASVDVSALRRELEQIDSAFARATDQELLDPFRAASIETGVADFVFQTGALDARNHGYKTEVSPRELQRKALRNIVHGNGQRSRSAVPERASRTPVQSSSPGDEATQSTSPSQASLASLSAEAGKAKGRILPDADYEGWIAIVQELHALTVGAPTIAHEAVAIIEACVDLATTVSGSTSTDYPRDEREDTERRLHAAALAIQGTSSNGDHASRRRKVLEALEASREQNRVHATRGTLRPAFLRGLRRTLSRADRAFEAASDEALADALTRLSLSGAAAALVIATGALGYGPARRSTAQRDFQKTLSRRNT